MKHFIATACLRCDDSQWTVIRFSEALSFLPSPNPVCTQNTEKRETGVSRHHGHLQSQCFFSFLGSSSTLWKLGFVVILYSVFKHTSIIVVRIFPMKLGTLLIILKEKCLDRPEVSKLFPADQK